MLRILALIAAAFILLSRAGLCPRINKDAAIRCYDAVISTLSKLTLTHEPWLLGEREFSDMSGCCGEYSCDGTDLNGSDFVFGSSSVYEKKIKLTAEIETFSGSAEMFVIISGEKSLCRFDKNGRFEGTFVFSGSSGVAVDYDGFTGSIKITSEEAE